MAKFYLFSKILLVLALTGSISWLTWLAKANLDASRRAIERFDTTILTINTVATAYEEQLTSDRSRKALQASIEAAAAWKATALLVNTTTIPNINRAVMELERSAKGLTVVTQSANKLVEEQNANVSANLSLLQSNLAASEAAINTLNRTIGGVGEKVEGVALEAGRTASVLGGASSEVALTAQELRRIAENFRKASESAPGTARAVERIAQSSSKWQSALRIIQIVATLGVLIK